MTRFGEGRTIDSKSPAILVLTAAAGFLVALIAIAFYELWTHPRQAQQRFTRLATTMALHTRAALAVGDRAAAAELLDALRLDEDVVAAGVIGLATMASLALALVVASRLRPAIMTPIGRLTEATAAPEANDPSGTPAQVADGSDSTGHPISDAATRAPEPSLLAGRALLAEDNPVNQTVARCMLESLGVVVDVAANGREAVERVAAARYDLVLMDCQMPELDGFAATAEIRRRELAGGTRTTIVALTAHALDGDRAICIAAGMDDYLSKPFTRERLAATLKRWLPKPPTARKVAVPLPSSPEGTAVASTTDMVADPPLNPRALETIRRLPGDNGYALVNKVIRAYLADAPARFVQMQTAADAWNGEGLRKAAHSLKSSSANVGAERLAWLCKELETMGRNGTFDEMPHLVNGIAAELNRVLAALGSRIAEGSENALA